MEIGMKRTILLFMGLLFASSSSQLVAMEEPSKPSIVEIIENDDIKTLDRMIRAKEIDPNKADIKISRFHSEFSSPLDVAVEFCSVKSVELLSAVTESNELLLQALENALRLGNVEVKIKGRDQKCRMQILNLLLNKVRELDLDIQSVLGAVLGTKITESDSSADVAYIRFLLSIGADRTYRYPSRDRDARGESLIEGVYMHINLYKNELPSFKKRIESGDPKMLEWLKIKQDIITLLRTYAPDLKTRVALIILNQVREGKITEKDFEENPLPRDIIELIAKLADIDPEAKKAWIAIGMPAYPLPPEEQAE